MALIYFNVTIGVFVGKVYRSGLFYEVGSGWLIGVLIFGAFMTSFIKNIRVAYFKAPSCIFIWNFSSSGYFTSKFVYIWVWMGSTTRSCNDVAISVLQHWLAKIMIFLNLLLVRALNNLSL